MEALRAWDVAVLGAGPAGSAAAITAARAGARVVLLERSRFPRHKVCGEFVSPEALALLRQLVQGVHGAEATLQCSERITRARVLIGSSEVTARIEPAALSLARYDLDVMLWDAAGAAGVERAQQAVESIERNGDGFRVGLAGGELRARAVVNAAGRWSKLNTQSASDREIENRGAEGRVKDRWLGLKCHYAAPNAEEFAGTTWLFGFRGGYCGVQQVRCEGELRLNACALVRPAAATDMQAVLAAHPQLRKLSRSWRAAIEPLATSPVVFGAAQPVREGALQAGDAAAFIDPFVGDGIAIALRGGAMAGELAARVASGDLSMEDATAAYAAQYRAAFAPAFRNARWLRRLLEMPQAMRRPLVGLLKLPGAAEWAVRATRSVSVCRP